MSYFVLELLFITVFIVHLDCEVYNDRPKIKTENGHLILEPASGKNIYLRPSGAKSGVFINDINLLHINVSQALPYSGTSAIISGDTTQGHNDILRRLETLENKENVPFGLASNISLLWRKLDRMTTTVHRLQNLIRNTITADRCESRPCENGGTCLSLVNDYHCLCPSNFEGKDCNIDVNECRNFAGTDLGCQNGATCINKPGSYECMCRSGWFGIHCTRKAKDCSGGDFEMCGHGICVPVTTGTGIKCLCDQGWTTNGTDIACLTDVNECESSQGPHCSVNPKVNCINLPGSFRCESCPRGFEGDGYICSDIDECTIDNGGCSTSPMVACHNTLGSRICGPCPSGYIGDGVTCSWRGSCSINHGGCHPSARCIENSALGQMSQCICPEGMNGDGIGISGCYVLSSNSSLHCENNPCGIHGRCHPLRQGYACICVPGYGGAHCEAPVNYCSSRPCRNGGICRPDDTTLRGFRCECSARFTGDLCQVLTRTCGGVIDAQEGSIFYPLTNTTYNHNSRCAWVIRTSPDKVLNITFTKFDIETNPECGFDFLQIHDGRSSASQLVGRFCGTTFPKGGNIISTHNSMYFWFRSDETITRNGFSFHWNSIPPFCGGDVDASTHGRFTSPGSPGKYPSNRDCFWSITTTFGKRVQLHFFELDLEKHQNCSFDYLAIYDGEHVTDPLIAKFCNASQPAPIQSSGSDMLVHFHSDAASSGNGFQISYATVEGVPGCGGLLTGDKGEITSPSYDGKYLNNLICDYKIQAPPESRIKIEFKFFLLETSFRCKYDYLKVYDGSSADSRLVGRFCGSRYPQSYVSSSNSLFIKFKTDRSIASEGFKISYELICRQTFTGDSGIIKSPGYPFNYTENKVCDYIISTSPGKAIELTFQTFDIEDNKYFNCQYDHVEVRDGPNINSTSMGKFCGSETPPVLISTYNYMYIRFNSDMSVSGAGFLANYTTVDVACGGIYKETTGLINHPSETANKYERDQKCSWFLIAPPGQHIKLTWNRFELEGTPSCQGDYLIIEEIDEQNNKYAMPKFCGHRSPPTMTTATNRVNIKFESDSSIQAAGFSMSYTFLDDHSHCGGIFIRTHGTISSPGWPRPYDANRECVWTITVPFGQQIKLNVSQFDLERPIRDKCDLGDYLEIRNGASENSPTVGKYCGTNIPKSIISTGNSLYIRFYSDIYLSGNGFKIDWDGTLQGCGGTLTGSKGSISSPNYPNKYYENAECFYKIITSHGSKIKISFSDIDLEQTRNCLDDYVEIYDGRDSNAPNLGRFCTVTINSSNIETSTNYAFIKFRSDFLIGGKGFLLNYYTICQNNLTGSYGIIESPNFPNNYPINLNCKWIITVPLGNTINITFNHFDVLKNYYSLRYPQRQIRFQVPYQSQNSQDLCRQDYVQIKETSDNSYMNKLCGPNNPPRISTHGNSIQVEFVTHSFTPKSGFRLEWVKNGCGGHLQKNYGVINFNKVSTGPIECEWILETSPGTGVSINFFSVHMADTSNCTTDALEVYGGPTIHSPLITKICHKGFSLARSPTNMMLLRLVKHSTLRDIQFMGQFDSSHTGCGGRIDARLGTIYSTNYPKNYDSNMDCLWTITVPNFHRIEFNILDLDLYEEQGSDYEEESSKECGDFIKIFDADLTFRTNYSHIICPNSRVSQIISKSNVLGVQFVTDEHGTAKGFKANFTVICGSEITAKNDGILKSGKTAIHSNINCTWTIVAPKLEQKVSLTLTQLSIPKTNDVETNRHCPSSFVRILDGSDENAPIIDEFCGNKVPPMIVSHGNAITIQFGSYVGPKTGHFSAHYTTVDSACGGEIFSEQGSLASPNYPNSYPVNSNCEWYLSTSPGNRVYITFEKFDLEFSEGCNEDYLEVRENNGGGHLLGVYCGTEIPTNVTIATKMYIKFHSDNKKPGQGFLLHYEFLHGNDITGQDSGEVSSPLYPHPYERAGEYTWRIISTGSEPIIITVKNLEIPVNGPDCYNFLSFYDGYDDEAPLLQEFCGVLRHDDSNVITTSSNIVYVKLKLDETNTGSLFSFRWQKKTVIHDENDSEESVACGSNVTEVVLPGMSIMVTSPNYPQEYDNNLNCEWILRATPGRHLTLTFTEVSLEEQPECFADYINIYSSPDLKVWKPLEKKICLSNFVGNELTASAYIKIKFRTDSSLKNTGFRAIVKSVCGGMVSGSNGVIGPSWQDWRKEHNTLMKCEWVVKVRPGRTINLMFEHFNITNSNDHCESFVFLRNGDSNEAPILGKIGKYCGFSNEKYDSIETSSNALFISCNIRTIKFENFRIRYEEKNVECGATSSLDSDHKWEVISSPNYPSVPTPFSECEWVFTGPPGEILRIDFIDRFDLERDNECTKEFVEIRDGTSELSPLKGRYCDEKPGSIKTSSNAVNIKYLTQLAEPRNGFKANISIDICGGTIVGNSGEIMSPGYPHMLNLPVGSVCEWKIVGYNGRVFKIKPQDIHLPDTEASCATKVTIEETLKVNKTVNRLKTFCNEEEEEHQNSQIIETTTNIVTIKLYIGKPSEWKSISDARGFRLTFNSSRPVCGGSISASEGFLTTPGYPLYTSQRYCQWLLTAPDSSRRIRLEIMDGDIGSDKQRIGVFNDINFHTSIKNKTAPNVYESSGNKLAIYLWLSPLLSEHRFKAKFTSEDAALCGGTLSGTSGELSSPALDRSYYCEWFYVNSRSVDDVQYKTIYINAVVNSSAPQTRCRYSDPKLSIKAKVGKLMSFYRSLCGNLGQVSYSIPASNMELKAIQSDIASFDFHITWKIQPCGGLIRVGENSLNVLEISSNFSGSLDCAWIVMVPHNNRIEMKLQGSFKLDCNKEFLQIKQGLGDHPVVLREYCKDKTQDPTLTMQFSYVYIQYHTETNKSDIKLMVQTINNQCGGYLTKFENSFTSPNYPKNYFENQECAWEIKADLGSRISLKFVDRFVVEKRPNCTKDAVFVYDWVETGYVQLAKLCGRELPPVAYNSTSNQMKVVLRTDADVNLDGFRAIWAPICGNNLQATNREQFLYSPGYPNEYSPNLSCDYEISVNNGNIVLKFLDFEVEGFPPNCDYDNLTISGLDNENEWLEETLCGSSLKETKIFSDKVNVNFRSDGYLQKKGFKLSYKIYSCGGEIKEPTVLTSGDDKSDGYGSNLNCTWLIEAPTNKVVVLKFLYIDLEDSEDCYTDYLSVYNGNRIFDDKRIGILCGHVNSTSVFRSTGNKMVLQFVSDFALSYKGFRVEVFFSFNEAVGCGGQIDLSTTSSTTVKSPLIGGSLVYEDFLDCHWTVKAPEDKVINIEFTSFHIAPCKNVNQTALGYSKCKCDLVELRDGINPNSLLIGTYCGHTLPPKLVSSGSLMGIRLYTDGDIESRGFEARLSVSESSCGPTNFQAGMTVQKIKTPGFDTGTIPRGLHCVFRFHTQDYLRTRVRINTLDLQEGSVDKNTCDADRIVIMNLPSSHGKTLGTNFTLRYEGSEFFSAYLPTWTDYSYLPQEYVFCGKKEPIDLFVMGSLQISVQTAAESDTLNHKGVELELSPISACAGNYSGLQGRVTVYSSSLSDPKECYTLITAPENYTLSIYFFLVSPAYYDTNVYLDIFDGDKTSSKRLVRIASEYEEDQPVFSTGRYLLLKHVKTDSDQVNYDFNFVATDKGSGCGGKLNNIFGKVTSPMYPDIYRKLGTCEWELETPVGTTLHLHFSSFNFGVNMCDQNYIQLVNRQGDVISSYCAESPADYTSIDNYVKLVLKTTQNNSGNGFVAMFVGTK